MAQARALRAKRLRSARSSSVGSPGKAKARGSRNGSTSAALHGFDPYAPSESMTKEERLLARKIRNRQSAALSRQRKTDLIEELEQRVRQLSHENSVLKARLRAAEGVPTSPTSAVSAAAELVAELCTASQFEVGKSSSAPSPIGDSDNSSDEEVGLPVRKRARSVTHRHNLRPHVQPTSRFARGTPASAAAVSKTKNLMMDQRFNQPLPAVGNPALVHPRSVQDPAVAAASVLPLRVPRPPLQPRTSFVELAEITKELDMDEAGAVTDTDVDEESLSAERSSLPSLEAETPDHSDAEPATPRHVDDQDLALEAEMIDTLLQDLIGPSPLPAPPATPVVQMDADSHFPASIFD